MAFIAPAIAAVKVAGTAIAATKTFAVVNTAFKAFSAVSTILGAFSSVQGSQIQAQQAVGTQQNAAAISNRNAVIASQNAAQARLVAANEASELRIDARRKASSIRARAAAGGVVTTAGSPLLASTEQVVEGARASEKRLFSGELQARGFESQSVLDTFKADIAVNNVQTEQFAGRVNTNSEIFGGFKNITTVGQNIL